MKKKQGFTLIELLAVIVILAVIALITTPLILGLIEKAKKGALEDTAYGLIDSANIYFAEGILDESQSKTEFTFEDGKQTSEKKLSYKGKVEKGSLRLFSDGKNALCISDGKNSVVKNVNDKKVKVVTGRCSYNSETDEYETVGVCQDLQDELDELKRKHQEELDRLKKEYEDQINQLKKDHADQIKALEETYKDQIDALNQKIAELETTHQAALDQLKKDYEDRIKTLTEAYENQIAELNRQLNIFKTGGTASVTHILAGQTAFVKGTMLTGTMPNRGAVNSTLNAGGSYTIPEGYHNGSGKISANSNVSNPSGYLDLVPYPYYADITVVEGKKYIVSISVYFDDCENNGTPISVTNILLQNADVISSTQLKSKFIRETMQGKNKHGHASQSFYVQASSNVIRAVVTRTSSSNPVTSIAYDVFEIG